jgi:hypothetical protein
MKTLVIKNISDEGQLIRSSVTANKETLEPDETREVEESLAKHYAKSYPKIFRIEGKGEVNIDEILGFIAKGATEGEKELIREALGVVKAEATEKKETAKTPSNPTKK